MGKYSHLETEFTQGFIDGKWNTQTQYAITKGINPTNGAYKKDCRGWVQKAEKLSNDVPQLAKEKAREKYTEQAVSDWVEVYSNLGKAAINVSTKIRELSEEIDFTYADKNETERVDIAALKGLMEAGLHALNLHRKTYTSEDIPLPTESKHKIEETKRIKAEEKGATDDSPIEERINAKMKSHGLE